jgi:hypothetical protein
MIAATAPAVLAAWLASHPPAAGALYTIAAAADPSPAAGLTFGGVLFMLLAWGAISALAAWCFSRILAGKPRP